MKTGIFGGAFDPPHKEHIRICLRAAEELNLEKIILVPSGIQPHKNSSVSGDLRLKMVEAASKPYENLSVDDIELDYNATAYAADILPRLKDKYGDIVYIIGGDSFLSIRKWYQPEKILRNFSLAVAVRGGNTTDILKEINEIKNLYNTEISVLKYQPSDISSTVLRAMLELGLDVNDLIDETVIKIIKEYNLYHGFEKIIRKLKEIIDERTFAHTARTALKALELNEKVNLPFEKVFTASLLHDVGKNMPYDEKYEKYIPDKARDSAVMHAFQGAAIAEVQFGIKDNDIIEAIRYHTTGKPGMTELQMIVFLADMIEDGRVFEGVGEIRKKAKDSLEAGFIEAIKRQYNYLKEKKNSMYPLTEESYKYYINKELQ